MLRSLHALVFLMILVSCEKDPRPSVGSSVPVSKDVSRSNPLTVLHRFPETSSIPAALFVEVPLAETGIRFVEATDVTTRISVIDATDEGYPGLTFTLASGSTWAFQQTAPFRFETMTPAAITKPLATNANIFSREADLNNDGYPDVISMGPEALMGMKTLLNSGEGHYLDYSHLSGLAIHEGGAVCLADFDNDGFVDAFLGKDRNGTSSPQAYRNRDGTHFEGAESWGISLQSDTTAAAWADFDQDGHLDLVVGGADGQVQFFRNQGSQRYRSLLSLRTRTGDSSPLGVSVSARMGTRTLTRRLTEPGDGGSSDQPVIHFGLGDVPIIDEMIIHWPSGAYQILTGVEANTHLLIVEPNTSVNYSAPELKPMYAAAPDEDLSVAKHTEEIFDDFVRSPGLPYKLSQLGPGIAVEDLDGDGDEDVVIAAARGEQPQAHFWHANQLLNGVFTVGQYETLCEDMAPLLFDADADGDLDWFCVSGGVEHGDVDHLLKDRLYVQVSTDNYVKSTTAIPDLRFSGGGAAAADMDRDGDLDLVVVGRVTDGEYTNGPGSVFLRNDSAGRNQPKFTDTTATIAPGLRDIEMATSVLWSDANDDGWIDLFIATEGGPIRLFLNRAGVLEDGTVAAGLESFRGRWNGLAGRDLDNDGDIDYVATNFGRPLPTDALLQINTVASSTFINDGHGHFTLRELPEMAQTAPGFGVVATEVNGDGHADIYLVQNLSATRSDVGTLAGGLSALLLGDGRGNFNSVWPNQSGLIVSGDARGLATMDFNADGWVDFIIANNNDFPQVFVHTFARDESLTPITVSLIGEQGNRTGIGSRVTVVSQGGRTQTAEVYAGGSYLSQSGSQLYYGNFQDDPAAKILVRWPDGSTSEHTFTNEGRESIIKPKREGSAE